MLVELGGAAGESALGEMGVAAGEVLGIEESREAEIRGFLRGGIITLLWPGYECESKASARWVERM